MKNKLSLPEKYIIGQVADNAEEAVATMLRIWCKAVGKETAIKELEEYTAWLRAETAPAAGSQGGGKRTGKESAMLGMKVKVQFTAELIARGASASAIYRNVTEIHYQYRAGMIAFESDVHGTGISWPLSGIRDFEALAESDKAEAF